MAITIFKCNEVLLTKHETTLISNCAPLGITTRHARNIITYTASFTNVAENPELYAGASYKIIDNVPRQGWTISGIVGNKKVLMLSPVIENEEQYQLEADSKVVKLLQAYGPIHEQPLVFAQLKEGVALINQNMVNDCIDINHTEHFCLRTALPSDKGIIAEVLQPKGKKLIRVCISHIAGRYTWSSTDKCAKYTTVNKRTWFKRNAIQLSPEAKQLIETVLQRNDIKEADRFAATWADAAKDIHSLNAAIYSEEAFQVLDFQTVIGLTTMHDITNRQSPIALRRFNAPLGLGRDPVLVGQWQTFLQSTPEDASAHITLYISSKWYPGGVYAALAVSSLEHNISHVFEIGVRPIQEVLDILQEFVSNNQMGLRMQKHQDGRQIYTKINSDTAKLLDNSMRAHRK